MKRNLFLLPFFLVAFSSGLLYADVGRSLTGDIGFTLRDSIKEFGEKRFIEDTPGQLRAGPLKIHPSLETRATFDNNILLEDQDAKDDFVFNVRPGVTLELPINKHQIAVGYEADFEFFTKETRQNDQNQNFFVLAGLNFPNWYINVLEEFMETSSRGGDDFYGPNSSI